MKYVGYVKSCIALALTLVAFAAVLGPSEASAWWTGAQNVTEVYAGYADGSVYVQMSGVGCSAGIAKFDTGGSDPKKVLSIATSALVSGSKFECAVNSCDSNGYGVGAQCRLYAN